MSETLVSDQECRNNKGRLTSDPTTFSEPWAKAGQISISQFAIFKQLTSFKIIELNRFTIFLHEIFRINVELNFDLSFGVNFKLGL